MVKFPKNDSPSGDQMLRDAKTLMEYHFEHFTLHGIRFGRGMETISTPRFPKGILITWPFGTLGFSLTENPNDSHIHIKEYLKHNIEDLCHIYLYGYAKHNHEDPPMPARITRRKPLQTPGQDQLPDDAEMEVSYDHKRKDPETRTLVIAPEKKKQKILWTSTELLHQRSIWWMMQRSRKINLEPTPIWYELDDRRIQKKAAS